MTEFKEEKIVDVPSQLGEQGAPAPAVIPTEAFPEMGVYVDKGVMVLNRARSLEVVDETTLENAAIGRQKIKEYMDNIDAKRKFFVQPLQEQVHKINMLFKQLYDPFKEARDILSEKMASWEKKQREARAAEERQRLELLKQQQEAMKKAETPAEPAEAKKLEKEIKAQEKAVEKAATGKGSKRKTAAGTTVSFSSKLEITIEDFSKIPDGYKELNEKKVREAYTTFEGKLEIPGLKLEMVPVAKTGG